MAVAVVNRCRVARGAVRVDRQGNQVHLALPVMVPVTFSDEVRWAGSLTACLLGGSGGDVFAYAPSTSIR
ncbi:hypothetical protein AB0G32_02260 [Streptomyces sp. NPDC023723]|uniref:hypothetical protein n=1 Tax=Streptomyces sp. NPDC023723 TaxID=3154323 RepID=UPI0033C3EAF8